MPLVQHVLRAKPVRVAGGTLLVIVRLEAEWIRLAVAVIALLLMRESPLGRKSGIELTQEASA